MYVVVADDSLACNKCWFTSIDAGEACISDAPAFRNETARKDVDDIRHWHLSRPDHPDSCYERELREWSSSPVSEPTEMKFPCAYCGHTIPLGSDTFQDQIWLSLGQDSRDLANVEVLQKNSGFRVRDANGNFLAPVSILFHDGCAECGQNTNCHSLYAQASVKGEAPEFNWSDVEIGDDDGEDSYSDSPPGIAERVRFWEEQDEINKVLIPRVIRQHELLAQHIGEHENLPLVVAQAVQQAVEQVREEQRQLYESALETAKSEFEERLEAQQRQYDEALSAARAEFTTTLEVTSHRLRNVSLIAGASVVAAALLVSVLAALLIG